MLLGLAGVVLSLWPATGLVLLGVSIGLLVWLFPGMGELTGPALAYQLIITTMVCMAFIVKAPVMARLGALLFMLSDTLIAAGRFANVDVPPGSVWITYAGAQIMIAWVLKDEGREDEALALARQLASNGGERARRKMKGQVRRACHRRITAPKLLRDGIPRVHQE